MTFECIWLLVLLAPTALWTMFNSHRSDKFNRFLIKAFGATLLLLNSCLPGFILHESRAAANVLADALARPAGIPGGVKGLSLPFAICISINGLVCVPSRTSRRNKRTGTNSCAGLTRRFNQ